MVQGTIEGNQIVGNWADVPLGGFRNGGSITLRGTFCRSNGCNANVSLVQDNSLGTWWTSNGVFDRYQWEKLYDRLTCNPPEVCNRETQ